MPCQGGYEVALMGVMMGKDVGDEDSDRKDG
jgi:hypothetical protein